MPQNNDDRFADYNFQEQILNLELILDTFYNNRLNTDGEHTNSNSAFSWPSR